MDSLLVQAMAADLHERLAGSRVERIVQPAAGTLVVRLWTGREKCQLLLRADAQSCFFVTSQTYPAPAAPPRFCQLLRARLRRLLAIHADPHDRIVHFRFAGAAGATYDLVLELVGARGNLLLVDTGGSIIDLLWRKEGERALLPGEVYRPPKPLQTWSLIAQPDDLLAALQAADDPGRFLRDQVTPMTPALFRAIKAEIDSGRTCGEVVRDMRAALERLPYAPYHVSWGRQSGGLPFAIGLSAFDKFDRLPDLSTLVALLLSENESISDRDQEALLRQAVQRQKNRLLKRLDKIKVDLERDNHKELLRINGELLLANLYRLERGTSTAMVENYYLDPPESVEIELDARLTPQQNAERYFKLYRKARRAEEHLNRRMKETLTECEWLDQIGLALEEAENADDLYQVQSELEAAGLLKKTVGRLGRRPAVNPADRLRKSTTPGGLQLYLGRNNLTNDYISRQMTGPGDIWMHAHRIPGCHLVLKTGNHPGPVPEEDLLYAAALAAGYSQGRHAGKVEVMIAEGRSVRKPKGARPGLVTVDRYRTVMVAPIRIDA